MYKYVEYTNERFINSIIDEVYRKDRWVYFFRTPIEECIDALFLDLFNYVHYVYPNIFFEKVLKREIELGNGYLNTGRFEEPLVLKDLERICKLESKDFVIVDANGRKALDEEQFKNCSISDFKQDQQVYARMFAFRIFSNEDRNSIGIFRTFVNFRNEGIAHNDINDKDEYLKKVFQCNDYRWVKENIVRIPQVIKRFLPETDIKELEKICSAYSNFINILDSNLNIKLNGAKPIDPERTTPIGIKELMGYTIVTDENVFLDLKYSNYIYDLSKSFPVYYTVQTLEEITKTKIGNPSVDYTYYTVSKNALDRLKTGLETSEYKFGKIDPVSNYGKEDYDSIEAMERFVEVEGSEHPRLCMITNDPYLIKRFWEIAKEQDLDDFIVIYPISTKEAKICKVQDEISFEDIPPSAAPAVKSKTDYIKPEKSVNSVAKQETINQINSYVASKPVISEEVITPVLKENLNNSSDDFRYRFNAPYPKENDPVIIKWADSTETTVKLAKSQYSAGGEGNIYCFENNGYINDSLLIKIYKKNVLSRERESKIAAMVEFSRSVNFAENHPNICWPLGEVRPCFNKDIIIGYVMCKADDAIPLSSLISRIVSGGETSIVSKREDLVKICQCIAQRFKELHSISGDVLMGDINLGNILVRAKSNEEKEYEIYFVDVDSYQFKDFNCPVAKPDFLSPELHKKNKGTSFSKIKRTMNDERFAIAVTFFYILALKDFPFSNDTRKSLSERVINGEFDYGNDDDKLTKRHLIYKNLSNNVREYFIDCFARKKYADITDEKWIKVFREMYNEILNGKLSNMLYPSFELDDANDRFLEGIKCNNCGLELDFTKSALENDSERWCSKCKQERAVLKASSYVAVCDRCYNQFTINAFDLSRKEDVFKNKVLCPDCNQNFKFSDYGRFFQSNINEKQKEFDELLKKKTINALFIQRNNNI